MIGMMVVDLEATSTGSKAKIIQVGIVGWPRMVKSSISMRPMSIPHEPLILISKN